VATAENPETVKRLHNSLFLSITWLFHAALKQRETDCNSRDQRSALCQRLCVRRDLPRARHRHRARAPRADRKSFWTAASFSAAFEAPLAIAQPLASVELLAAFHAAFGGRKEEAFSRRFWSQVHVTPACQKALDWRPKRPLV
jgi:hypothetical protein